MQVGPGEQFAPVRRVGCFNQSDDARFRRQLFEPARDGLGRAQASTLVCPVEWPSYWWMVKHQGLVTRLPANVGNLPCKGSGNPLNLDRAHPVYRDCSLPDLAKVPSAPWIYRPR